MQKSLGRKSKVEQEEIFLTAMQHRFGHATHVGNVRKHNEDDLAFDPSKAIYVVADGMGGHASGEVASRITVKTVLERYEQDRNLERAITSAHQAVKMAATRGVGKRGMGTTVVAVALNESELDYAWVGDSRIYLWTDDNLEQITKDHSYVQSLIDEGEISEREARVHPKRNIITQCIGSQFNEDLQIGCAQVPLEAGDRILMCSDGLTSELNDKDIASVLASKLDAQAVADALIQSCLARKASDNITVIVIDIVDEDQPTPGKRLEPKQEQKQGQKQEQAQGQKQEQKQGQKQEQTQAQKQAQKSNSAE